MNTRYLLCRLFVAVLALTAGGVAAAAIPYASAPAPDPGLTRAVSQIAKRDGLFFFFRSDCPYCHADLPVLRTLQLTTGIRIVPITMNGQGIDDNLFPDYLIDSGQARRLGVTVTPTFFLVQPPNMAAIVPIGQGYMTLRQLETEIVQRSYYLNRGGAQ